MSDYARMERAIRFVETRAPRQPSLQEVAGGGPCPAQGLLEAYHGDWGGDIDKLFADIAY